MKTGIVFEGGASRTAFTNGVIDELLRADVRVNYVIGTSAGIGNGLSFISRQIGRNLRISMQYVPDKRYMGKRYLFKKGNRSYYNLPFVFDEIPNHYCPLDYEAFSRFEGEIYACVTDMNTGRSDYLPVNAEDKQWRAVMASCSLPLLFQPVNIGGHLYMDGGVACPVPYARALRDGCDKLIVVLTRERGYVKSEHDALTDASAFLYRNYPKFAHRLLLRGRIYNAQRQRLYELEREGRVFLITPENTAHFRRNESNPAVIRELYLQGCRCAKAEMPALKRFLETDLPESAKKQL